MNYPMMRSCRHQNRKEETEYNQEVLVVDAFTLKFALPDGWNVSEQADDAYRLMNPYGSMNMAPFADVLSGRGDFVRQVLLNIVMTMPFGFLFPMTRKPAAGFGKTVFFCFIMSLGIELLQPLLDGFRSADITDLITNTIGGAAGYIFYIIFRPIICRFLRPLKKRN